LRIISPLAGTTFLLDPDVPSSRRILLAGAGGEKLVWRSESLQVMTEEGVQFATGSDGEHRITLLDAESGRTADVQISIRSM
jgi:penicillin-binding protein 1C